MSDTLGSCRDSGFVGALGAGRAPAVLVVDLVKAYLDDASPLQAPVEPAVAAADRLVAAARTARVPVVFTRVSYLPGGGDVVVTKQYASAFFGTSLAATLTAGGIDTLYICGLTTSGCIRATATDAMQHGFSAAGGGRRVRGPRAGPAGGESA